MYTVTSLLHLLSISYMSPYLSYSQKHTNTTYACDNPEIMTLKCCLPCHLLIPTPGDSAGLRSNDAVRVRMAMMVIMVMLIIVTCQGHHDNHGDLCQSVDRGDHGDDPCLSCTSKIICRVAFLLSVPLLSVSCTARAVQPSHKGIKM